MLISLPTNQTIAIHLELSQTLFRDLYTHVVLILLVDFHVALCWMLTQCFMNTFNDFLCSTWASRLPHHKYQLDIEVIKPVIVFFSLVCLGSDILEKKRALFFHSFHTVNECMVAFGFVWEKHQRTLSRLKNFFRCLITKRNKVFEGLGKKQHTRYEVRKRRTIRVRYHHHHRSYFTGSTSFSSRDI